jgi:hypothetical protein
MYKVMLSIRNRLAITIKCVAALKKHSVLPHQIYVYDNLTDDKVLEHFVYWGNLYKNGLISQVNFTTKESTFGAFSKASASNFFGLQHEQDPLKDKYDFLVFLDNDIILTPGWDEVILQAWRDVDRLGLKNVKVIGQLPGGIKGGTETKNSISGCKAILGKLGGSGFWTVRPDFFRDIGYLDLKQLVGFNKRHDQLYWNKMDNATKGCDYILGLRKKLAIHCGKYAGSVCNTLNKYKDLHDPEVKERFDEGERYIDSLSFEEFYKKIYNDPSITKDW